MKMVTHRIDQARRTWAARSVFAAWIACCVLLGLSATVQAEQNKKIGPYDVHYIAFPTTFLSPEIARQYNIVRGKDRALVNISILDNQGKAVAADIRGTMKNLPGQILPLDFVEVREGDALYYLASARYTDQEIVRFKIEFTPQTSSSPRAYQLEFQQKLYREP